MRFLPLLVLCCAASYTHGEGKVESEVYGSYSTFDHMAKNPQQQQQPPQPQPPQPQQHPQLPPPSSPPLHPPSPPQHLAQQLFFSHPLELQQQIPKYPESPPLPAPPEPSRMPLYLANPNLARRLGFSTFMMGSVLYGLSLIPALLAVTGVGPIAGLFGGLGRKKRKKRSAPPVLPNFSYKFREMPLLDNRSSHRFLSMIENTMEMRKIDNPFCKKHYTCRVYRTALASGQHPPTLATFETAILDTFGIAAERVGYRLDLIPAVMTYFDAALVGLTGGNCTKLFPCSQPFYRFYPIGPKKKFDVTSGRSAGGVSP